LVIVTGTTPVGTKSPQYGETARVGSPSEPRGKPHDEHTLLTPASLEARKDGQVRTSPDGEFRNSSSMLRKKLRPSLQICRLCLIERHCFVHAHLSPEQKFDFIFPARSEPACVRLEPAVLRFVRPTHPVWEPVIKLARGFLRTSGVSVSTEDCIFLGVGDAARSVSVRDAR
jgi:hypothetical protein